MTEQNIPQQNPTQQPAYGQPMYGQQYDPRYKVINKHLFVWLGAFFFGGLGVDRFMRGQVGLGIFKLLIGWWATLGIWPLVDWIIAVVKAYGSAYSAGEEIVFDASGHYIR
ncbi:TM2 domain-containing membrane protein YozV [Arcanobacterium wilhelmae]|uniref:TM2 domain-containing membrane protein YozV n=1 Tax=Arcanobacterium wilhelmae TaxID=1803177 RepID=A0ABT9NB75_9ACTO|nr:TM2 domain-containing protein [Arcanobacterium wilhelmae]MDP9800969.1 TM2 domain-containing membrane protein YozV [Arcanobacterium wilhelmae]WFN90329.1 TM2 domain-containing protein [Arcanobacterium wilhelmae]